MLIYLMYTVKNVDVMLILFIKEEIESFPSKIKCDWMKNYRFVAILKSEFQLKCTVNEVVMTSSDCILIANSFANSLVCFFVRADIICVIVLSAVYSRTFS